MENSLRYLDAFVSRHVYAHITACFYRAFSGVLKKNKFIICFASFFIFHLVRQPYSETSCSCVLVDWSIVWKGDQSKPKRKVKGMTRAINCTLFSFLKCEEMWNIIPGFMRLSKHRYWICCYIYCLHLQVFCAFAALSRGLVPYLLRFFFFGQLYIAHIT